MIELLLRLIILNCITFYVIFNILVAPLLSWHDTLSNNYNIPWLYSLMVHVIITYINITSIDLVFRLFILAKQKYLYLSMSHIVQSHRFAL
jgi:hypothetical protein